MAVNNIIVYFPWGAGGNLIRNIITLDPRFEFFNDARDRYTWLLVYYSQPVLSETWLPREWSIRQKFYNKYYKGYIAYWNPNWLLAYDCHGTDEEIKALNDNNHLLCYDRYLIDRNMREEQQSPWRLKENHHIFLLPKNIELILDVYHSKNPSLNQFDHIPKIDRKTYTRGEIIKLSTNLRSFADSIPSKQIYVAEDLFQSPNIILDIVSKLNLNISTQHATTIHAKWLQTTRKVYYNYYNRELTL